jgi:hypothetical protein
MLKRYGRSPVEAVQGEVTKMFVLKEEIIRNIWNKSVGLMEEALDLAVREGVDKTEILMCLNDQVEDIYEI